MANLKYSRQREAIKDYLVSTTAHPTADTVYIHVRKEFPNISLGTIYRNLNLLADLGDVNKIITPDGSVRFDAYTKPHCHFCCKSCGKVIDMNPNHIEQIRQLASKDFDGKIEAYSILFTGLCNECREDS
ncbi:MAG: transcriptional repressor [Coprococcus sp.]|nr:transcriptional repressor [Coprococcus sp.]